MQKDQQKLAQLIQGKKVAFIGAGVSHKTLIKEFVELGAHVTLCDQKKSVEDFGDYAATIRELGIDLSLGENYLDGFKGQDIIMRTPGFVGYFEKPLQDAMAAGTMVTSEVELFFEFCPCEIVAVTGSDGKTTTTTLISKFYEAAGRKVHLGGNIGAALLPMLPEVSPEDVAVVELSSFQLISMHSSPNIAVVTNVTPNHLDHHKDMQEYIDAKRNILLYQKQPCRAVLGYENEISRSMQADCKGKQVWFTRLHETDNGAFLRDDGMLCMAEDGVVTPFLAQKDVKLRGLHNIENLLAAAAAVWGEVPVEAIRQVGSTFTGVEHRIEPVRTLDGVLYYNDSIGTSPTRTIAGLRSFDRKVILIAGGYDKHIPYEPLAPEIIAHVKNLVLMGATGPRIEQAVRECSGFDEAALPIQHADNMQHAVELARAAQSPAISSSCPRQVLLLTCTPTLKCAAASSKRLSTRSSDRTGKGCKAPHPVRECLPGSAGAGRSAAAGLYALSQKSAVAVLRGPYAGAGTFRQHGMAGRARKPRRTGRLFVLLRVRERHSGRDCLPAAGRLAQGGSTDRVRSAAGWAAAPAAVDEALWAQLSLWGRSPPPGWQQRFTQQTPPGRQIFTQNCAQSAAGAGQRHGHWSRGVQSFAPWALMPCAMGKPTWPAGRPQSRCGARASAGGSLWKWLTALPPRVCARCSSVHRSGYGFIPALALQNRQSTPAMCPRNNKAFAQHSQK